MASRLLSGRARQLTSQASERASFCRVAANSPPIKLLRPYDWRNKEAAAYCIMSSKPGAGRTAGLMIGALGVVYGDIGTSPLYAVRECFHGPHALRPTPDNIIGILSLIVWSLIIIVTIKYLIFVMRADNKGEGGILSLLALAFPDVKKKTPSRKLNILLAAGVFGAALLYGDGMITPAISVLGAIEGLEVATPVLKPYIVPVTVAILFGLFSVQRLGTGKVGFFFGPITGLWFLTIGTLGVVQILREPGVFESFMPWHAVEFFFHNGWDGFVVLGSVVLVVTGAEALYADMGHFGKRPIRYAWFAIVFPALLLNYLGQGALLLRDSSAAANPFYKMAPGWALIPLVILATAAACIASQALISGAYSLTMQAIQLGYSPRLQIDHTSAEEKGQIYLPKINWILMVCSIGLVLGFRSSSNLASAYGIAVTLTMIITNVLFYFTARYVWGWSTAKAMTLCIFFFIVEAVFCAANLLKIPHGGWFPLAVAAVVFTLMATWKTGRSLLGQRLRAGTFPLTMFLEEIEKSPPQRVKGTAIFLSGNAEGTPMALLHNLKHNKVLHERVAVLTILTAETPHVDQEERVEIEEPQPNFFRIIGKFGFMEDPNVPDLLAICEEKGLHFKPNDTTYFLSRETVIPSRKPGMMMWRERLFALMSRNAQSATAFFRIPPNRVVELGLQVEI